MTSHFRPRARTGGHAPALSALAAILLSAPPASAQALKAGLLGDPSVGRPASEIRLPYVRDGVPGPADQPFRLSAELGRVVVLAFGGTPDRAGWADLAARVDSFGSARVELVAVARARSGAVAAVAGRPGLKILADSLGLIHRLYGVRDKDGWAIFVVADDGRLIWKDRRPNLALAGWWAGLVAAVRRGAPTVAR